MCTSSSGQLYSVDLSINDLQGNSIFLLWLGNFAVQERCVVFTMSFWEHVHFTHTHQFCCWKISRDWWEVIQNKIRIGAWAWAHAQGSAPDIHLTYFFETGAHMLQPVCSVFCKKLFCFPLSRIHSDTDTRGGQQIFLHIAMAHEWLWRNEKRFNKHK